MEVTVSQLHLFRNKLWCVLECYSVLNTNIAQVLNIRLFVGKEVGGCEDTTGSKRDPQHNAASAMPFKWFILVDYCQKMVSKFENKTS